MNRSLVLTVLALVACSPGPDAPPDSNRAPGGDKLPALELTGLEDGAHLVKRRGKPVTPQFAWRMVKGAAPSAGVKGLALCIEAVLTQNCDGARSRLYDGLPADATSFTPPERDLFELRSTDLLWRAGVCSATGCLFSGSRQFSLTADMNGMYALVFSEASGNIFVSNSSVNGNQLEWSPSRRLTGDFTDPTTGETRSWNKQTDQSPAIATDRAGTFLAAWRIALHHPSGFLLATNIGEQLDGASMQWQGPATNPTVRLVMHDYKCESGPAVAFGNGRWVLMCRGNTTTPEDQLFVIQSADAFPGNWQTPTTVNLPAGTGVHEGTRPVLVHEGGRFVLMYEQANNEVVTRTSTDAVSWDAPVVVPDTTVISGRSGPRRISLTAYRGQFFAGVADPGSQDANQMFLFKSADAASWQFFADSFPGDPSPSALGLAIGALPILDSANPDDELECEMISLTTAPGLGGVRYRVAPPSEGNCADIREIEFDVPGAAGFGGLVPGSENAARSPGIAYGSNPL